MRFPALGALHPPPGCRTLHHPAAPLCPLLAPKGCEGGAPVLRVLWMDREVYLDAAATQAAVVPRDYLNSSNLSAMRLCVFLLLLAAACAHASSGLRAQPLPPPPRHHQGRHHHGRPL